MSCVPPADLKRPSPDALLAAACQEGQGRLRIFLGAAPGVGKTYAMLEAAQARRAEGADVVIGVVETHSRPETQRLLEGFEIVAPHEIEYRGLRLAEMDLDALLARRPGLALVDELAHTNVVGSRHPKRYQDVEELLDAGIDVYTTVNIQHLESLNDVVAQITGVRVRETIPDRLLERADEIELIDLSPDELLQRLQEGKVYVPDQAERAIRSYFRRGNLTALRELALRRTAERVDEQMKSYMQAHAIPGPWPACELIMVCVSSSPLSPQLVRTARRMADRRHAKWMAVYVETPEHIRMTDAARNAVTQTLRLAEQLGGEVVTIPGMRVADDLVRYARSRNVTEMIIGKSLRSRWDELWRGSVVHDIIHRSGDIDVYVITGKDAQAAGSSRPWPGRRLTLRPDAFLLSASAVAGMAVLARGLQAFLPLTDLTVVFLPAVLLSAVTWGLWVSIWACILSVLVYDLFFVPPFYTFTIASPADVLALIIFLIVAVLTSSLAARQRNQAEVALHRESHTAALYELGRQMVQATDIAGVLQAVVGQAALLFGARVVILLPEDSVLMVRASQPEGLALEEHERAAALWAWQHNHIAGRGSDTLPGAQWYFQPLATSRCVEGVLGLQFDAPLIALAPDQQRLLDAMAGQAALGIERARLTQQMAQAQILAETDRLRGALFSSISHDLRTPLASILGAASSLLSYGATYGEAARQDLLMTIQEEAERLNHFVGNLLDMTRLEAGALRLNRDWLEIGEVIASARARLAKALLEHPISIQIEPGLPLLWLDFVLMEQVFINLLDNAGKYSPAGAPINLRVYIAGDLLCVEVADEGIGVPAQDLERIFDKFYRVQREDYHGVGTGLGLSICRGIVEAHGGAISASLRSPGSGLMVTVRLPIQKAPAVDAEAVEPAEEAAQ